ncbi:MAG: hypothetical protein IMZ55_04585 [Acidobacteria bacterium]|nr:hypothetical protein [Acidobacteriota bacterium]
MKSNNLFGLKQSPTTPWIGSKGELPNGTVVFATEALSARAYFLNAENQLRKTAKTLYRFIADYAPAGDPIGSVPGNPPNDPPEYASYIAQNVYFHASILSEPLPLPSDCPDLWFSIACWASRYETGKPPHWGAIAVGLFDFLSIHAPTDAPKD